MLIHIIYDLYHDPYLGWVLGAYFFLVVWSFKKDIEDEVVASGKVQRA